MKTTPWFPGRIKPVHVGPYERQYVWGGSYWSFWNGKFWGMAGGSPNEAVVWKRRRSVDQASPWRGLTGKAE